MKLQRLPQDGTVGRLVGRLFPQTLATKRSKPKQVNISNTDRHSDELMPICELDFVLASSIHTIHRPVAHSRLATPSFNQSIHYGTNPPFEIAEDYFSNPLSTDEDDGLRDFDEATPQESLPDPFKGPQMRLQLPADKLPKSEGKRRMPPTMRTASMATVRMKRRSKLAEKLKEVFGVPEIKEVVAGKMDDLLRIRSSFLFLNYRDALLALTIRS
jgi:hypothetical protein